MEKPVASLTDLMKEIENLDSLNNLKQLWLGRNKISELKVSLCSIATAHED